MVAQVGGLMSAETDTLSQLLRLAKFSRVSSFSKVVRQLFGPLPRPSSFCDYPRRHAHKLMEPGRLAIRKIGTACCCLVVCVRASAYTSGLCMVCRTVSAFIHIGRSFRD